MLDSIQRRQRPATRVIAGLVLGFAGVAVLADLSNALSGTLADRILLLSSTFFWAAGSILARDGARPESAAQSAAMQLAAGSVALFVVSLTLGEWTDWNATATSTRAIASLAFLIICGTVLAFGAYTWLLRVTTPAALGSYAFVNPIVALLVAWSAGDEPLTVRTLIAGAMVITAVVLTRPASPSSRTQPRP